MAFGGDLMPWWQSSVAVQPAVSPSLVGGIVLFLVALYWGVNTFFRPIQMYSW
ncbi:MAG: hypothetical protein R2856_03960 [Caldilineaceae bacterium]